VLNRAVRGTTLQFFRGCGQAWAQPVNAPAPPGWGSRTSASEQQGEPAASAPIWLFPPKATQRKKRPPARRILICAGMAPSQGNRASLNQSHKGMADWEGAGAQGRNRTTDTVIFSHVLYQLSYLGGRRKTARASQKRRCYRGSGLACPAHAPLCGGTPTPGSPRRQLTAAGAPRSASIGPGPC
jgi:hypothetical protein